MKAGVIRLEAMARERVEALRRMRDAGSLVTDLLEILVTEEELVEPAFLSNVAARMAEMNAVFIAVPAAYAAHLSTLSLRRGIHTFLGRSAVPSIAECKAIAALGEEAGVEVGVSRTVRFHPLFGALPDPWRPALLALRQHGARRSRPKFQRMIEDAVDLCCTLAGTSEVRRIEAQRVQVDPAHPANLMAGIRFQSGAYAQIQLRQDAANQMYSVYAGGGSFEMEADMIGERLFIRNPANGENGSGRFAFESHPLQAGNLIERETVLFLEAIANRKPAPVSIVDGMQTLRIVEAIRKNLR